jgi:uridine phosphorylase
MAADARLHPTAEVAPRALLPDDPGRALLLAQSLLHEPLMFNHARGLWGYSGRAADGEPLTIQSTGMGGPSAAIVVAELAELGVAEVVRVGFCAALGPEPRPGELVVVAEAIAADGASRAAGATDRVAADPELTAALRGDRVGVAVSHDLLHDPQGARRQAAWARQGAIVGDLETAAVLQVAATRGVRAACVLAVARGAGPEPGELDHDALVAASERLGALAAAALAR